MPINSHILLSISATTGLSRFPRSHVLLVLKYLSFSISPTLVAIVEGFKRVLITAISSSHSFSFKNHQLSKFQLKRFLTDNFDLYMLYYEKVLNFSLLTTYSLQSYIHHKVFLFF